MRPARFAAFAAPVLAAAPEVTAAEPWDGRLFGLTITLTSGARLQVGITGALPPGVKHEDPDVPVTGEPSAPIPWPALYDAEKMTTPEAVAGYLAAAITHAGNPEILSAAPYAAGQNPGFAVLFHNGSQAFVLIARTARTGQALGSDRLQSTF